MNDVSARSASVALAAVERSLVRRLVGRHCHALGQKAKPAVAAATSATAAMAAARRPHERCGFAVFALTSASSPRSAATALRTCGRLDVARLRCVSREQRAVANEIDQSRNAVRGAIDFLHRAGAELNLPARASDVEPVMDVAIRLLLVEIA